MVAVIERSPLFKISGSAPGIEIDQSLEMGKENKSDPKRKFDHINIAPGTHVLGKRYSEIKS